MAGMERFTQRARRVLSLAHQETERARSNQIGPEYLLLGLMDEEGGVGSRVLHELGLTSERVRVVVNEVSGASPDFDPNRVELASETQQALEYAVDEARRFGHHYIGTEHILLGLMRTDGITMDVLRRLGITAEHIRRQTRRVLSEATASPRSTTAIKSAESARLNQVLVIHGHGQETKETVAKYIENLGLHAIILHEDASGGATLNEKFEKNSGGILFVVALLTPDELVASTVQPQQTRFRASQNVIYELGFFHGKLGRNRVCVLVKSDPQTELELPSHFLGIVYIPLDASGTWRMRLAKEMQEAGLKINLDNIT